MALLRDTTARKPLLHAEGGRVVADGYIVTTTNGAILSSSFPAGYSVERSATGTYDITCPTAFHLGVAHLAQAHNLHKAQVTGTSGAGTVITVKTATLGLTVDQGPPVTVTPAYTVADVSGLIIFVLIISRE